MCVRCCVHSTLINNAIIYYWKNVNKMITKVKCFPFGLRNEDSTVTACVKVISHSLLFDLYLQTCENSSSNYTFPFPSNPDFSTCEKFVFLKLIEHPFSYSKVDQYFMLQRLVIGDKHLLWKIFDFITFSQTTFSAFK